MNSGPIRVFRDLLPRDFALFGEPDYVKIAWTLRADPLANGHCVFRTETRAIATDMAAREQFRRSLTLQPLQKNGWNNLGAVEAALGHDDDAIHALTHRRD